jgi:predicted amidophosphoribosyltransferase
MILIIPWFLFGIIAAAIGAKKGEGCLSLILGLLLGPIGILIVLLSKGNRQTCPYCRELVHKDAAICRHCGKSLAVRSKYVKPPWEAR